MTFTSCLEAPNSLGESAGRNHLWSVRTSRERDGHCCQITICHQVWTVTFAHFSDRSGRVVYSAVLAACRMDGRGFEPPMPVVLSAGISIKKAWLLCWPPYSQQVSHQRWIWGIHCAQVRKQASKGIHPGFKTPGRRHQKSKIGVSVAPQKGLMSSKK